jgi:hypothetical protein
MVAYASEQDDKRHLQPIIPMAKKNKNDQDITTGNLQAERISN